jgi:NADH-ubiquinone oxidoreductase chain 6
MKNLLIELLSFGALFSSILVITSKNPVVSVVFLVSTFVNAAGYLILMGVGFIGLSYIIVYVGAIAVLFLFVIMMINIKLTDIIETGNQYTKTVPLAIAIGLLFLYEIFTVLPFTINNVGSINTLLDIITSLNGLLFNNDLSNLNSVHYSYSILADTSFVNFLQVQAIGQGIYTYSAILLITASVILLLSMVAPIFISRIKTTN